MSEINAIVKSHGINLSNDGNTIVFRMDLDLPDNGWVGFTLEADTTTKNDFAYKLSAVMDILEVNDIDKIDGRPLVAIFEGDDVFIGAKLIGIKNFLDKCKLLK